MCSDAPYICRSTHWAVKCSSGSLGPSAEQNRSIQYTNFEVSTAVTSRILILWAQNFRKQLPSNIPSHPGRTGTNKMVARESFKKSGKLQACGYKVFIGDHQHKYLLHFGRE